MSMGSLTKFVFIAGLSAAVPPKQAPAQIPVTPPPEASAEDVVVTAQRIGIPVWRVSGPGSTVVLVGSIGRGTPGTQWDPSALEAALAQADQIMFPESMEISFGLFSVISTIGKWRAQAKLPNGQTIQSIKTPDQWSRLVALRDRGILRPGFERMHPYHLAIALGRPLRDRLKLDPARTPMSAATWARTGARRFLWHRARSRA